MQRYMSGFYARYVTVHNVHEYVKTAGYILCIRSSCERHGLYSEIQNIFATVQVTLSFGVGPSWRLRLQRTSI